MTNRCYLVFTVLLGVVVVGCTKAPVEVPRWRVEPLGQSGSEPDWNSTARALVFELPPSQKDEATASRGSPALGTRSAPTWRICLWQHDRPFRVLTEGRYPRWSPDGQHIAFLGRNTDGQYSTPSLYSVAKGQARTLVPGPYTGAGVWAPDGHHVAFVRTKIWEQRGDLPHKGHSWELIPVTEYDPKPARLTPGLEGMGYHDFPIRRQLSFSPSTGAYAWTSGHAGGRAIAYRTSQGMDEEYVRANGLPDEDLSTARAYPPEVALMEPRWHPLRPWLAFTAGRRIFLFDLETKAVTRLWPSDEQFSAAGGPRCLRWSPDGNALAFSLHRKGGTQQIWVVSEEELKATDSALVWSGVRGRKIAHFTWGPDKNQIFLVDAESELHWARYR